MRGVGVGKVEELLRSSGVRSPNELQAVLRRRGFPVEGAQYGTIAADLVACTNSIEDAVQAALLVWIATSGKRERDVMLAALRHRRGPVRGEQPAGVRAFFHHNGTPTLLGEAALALWPARTNVPPSGGSRVSHVAPVTAPSAPAVESPQKFQGRPEHQRLQQLLHQLGTVQKMHVRVNRDIGGGFRPDVVWYKLDPERHPRAGAHAVFEIEFGESAAIAKSLASLKHAFDLWPARLFLFVPEYRLPVVNARVDGMADGAFHEIKDQLTLHAVESCPNELFELAKLLRV